METASPWRVVTFAALDSTNEEARRRALAGDPGPCWIRAVRQTAGRGRLGRVWESPEGNLYATALFVSDRSAAETAQLSFAAGLAVIEAMEDLGADVAGLRLKWPNDVLAGSAKLAGVLIETGSSKAGGLWVAAGIGVNLASPPELPDRETAAAASLPGGADIGPAALLERLDRRFRALIGMWAEGGFADISERWTARALPMGARLSVSTSPPLAGAFAGLAADGALRLRLDDGEVREIRAGEAALAR